ncbi:hypothetical protein ACS0Y3_36855, partial [Burkholderia gladioli]|uniref:hypothetical protein n=1 Tax=Burkholderia gladioli TaxID=28095 RepID=UPI003F7A53CA
LPSLLSAGVKGKAQASGLYGSGAGALDVEGDVAGFAGGVWGPDEWCWLMVIGISRSFLIVRRGAIRSS